MLRGEAILVIEPEPKARKAIVGALTPRGLSVDAPDQLADTVELPVRQAESAMERLFRDLRQAAQCSREVGRARPRWNPE